MNGCCHLLGKVSMSLSSIFFFFVVLLCVACNEKDSFQIEQDARVNPWTSLNINNKPEKFQFALVTDLTGRLRPNVFPDAVKKLNLLQPEFVITMGDVIEGHTNDKEQLNQQWDQLFKAVEPLEMPLFWTPGNHDYWYASAQNAEGAAEQYSMSNVYTNRIGRSYYHFLYKNVLFLILNNTMDPNDPGIEAEKKFIKETLENNLDVRWTFTFFHWSRGFEGRKEEIWEYLYPLLKNRRFTAFGANSHQYVRYDFNGMDAINLATTGGMSRVRGPLYGEFDHIVWVTMTSKEPRIANLMLDGIYDKNVRTLKSKELVSQLLNRSPVESAAIFEKEAVFTNATTIVRLKNTADIPLNIDGVFDLENQIKPDPPRFSITIPASSDKRIDFNLRANTPIPISEVRPLTLYWKARYVLPGDNPNVEVSGKHRIVIDSEKRVTPPEKISFAENFAGKLDPSWIPLGPGGSFNEQGHFTLIDNPPELEGERKDIEGRYTDGPMYESSVVTPVETFITETGYKIDQKRQYRYIDSRGLFMKTPLFQLPVNGIYRDIPPDNFEAKLKISNIHWGGDIPIFRWEFWDSPDRSYNYGPSYLSGVVFELFKEDGRIYLDLHTVQRNNITDSRAESRRTKSELHYSDPKANTGVDLGRHELDYPPESVALRAEWREASRSWQFFYGLDGAEAKVPFPGGEFVEDINPSPEGKRNMIYIHQAKRDASLVHLQSGFSVVLGEYQLLHY